MSMSSIDSLFRSLLEKIPEGYLAIVSDSYDLFNMVEHILGEELKDKVRDSSVNKGFFV